MEYYVSVDIEADGPIPSRNSMLALGAVLLDVKGEEVSSFNVSIAPRKDAVQDPDTMRWWESQPKAWGGGDARRQIRGGGVGYVYPVAVPACGPVPGTGAGQPGVRRVPGDV